MWDTAPLVWRTGSTGNAATLHARSAYRPRPLLPQPQLTYVPARVKKSYSKIDTILLYDPHVCIFLDRLATAPWGGSNLKMFVLGDPRRAARATPMPCVRARRIAAAPYCRSRS